MTNISLQRAFFHSALRLEGGLLALGSLRACLLASVGIASVGVRSERLYLSLSKEVQRSSSRVGVYTVPKPTVGAGFLGTKQRVFVALLHSSSMRGVGRYYPEVTTSGATTAVQSTQPLK